MSGGSTSTINGNNFEIQVESLLQKYVRLLQPKVRLYYNDSIKTKYYRIADFIIDQKIIVEVKSQQVNGSVDEKLVAWLGWPYMLHYKNYNEFLIIYDDFLKNTRELYIEELRKISLFGLKKIDFIHISNLEDWLCSHYLNGRAENAS